jgi:hypothetical protein
VHCRESGPIEHSTVRTGFTVVRVASVLIGEAVIQTLMPTCVVDEECLEVFLAMCTTLLASYRRDTGPDVLGGGRAPDLW